MVQARIHPYFPYFHVDVLADCVLFKPAAGHILGTQTGLQAGALSPQQLLIAFGTLSNINLLHIAFLQMARFTWSVMTSSDCWSWVCSMCPLDANT